MKLVVFDLDGTLIDSHAFITSVMAETFTGAGLLPPDAETARGVIGLALPEALARLSGAKGEPLDALVERYRELFHARLGQSEQSELMFAGVREAVIELAGRGDVLLGIATGKALRGVERILELHGLGGYFVTRQTPDHNPSKPHPGMLISAMKETGAVPHETVMIGDTTFDIDMAAAAGTRAIGVSWGSHSPELLKASGASVVIDECSELISAIDQVLGGEYA